MTLQYLEALRNNRLDEITTLLDAGAGPALLIMYDGAQPITGGTATTEVATLTLADPAAPTAASAQLTLNPIISDPSATGGTTTWFRLEDSNNTFVMDGPIADLNLNTNVVTPGVPVAISTFIITAGNP